MNADNSHKPVGRLNHFVANGWRLSNVMLSQILHRPPAYLPAIMLFITYRCNLRCKMCGVCELESPADDSPELTIEECKAIVDSSVQLRTSLLVISGGEALLRPDVLFETAKHARDRGIAVHVCSNGVLLDAENAKRFAACGVNTVSISIESPVKSIHEALRGPDTFEQAVNAVQNLRQYAPNLKVGINCVITKQNFRNIEAMIPFAEKLGAHQLKFAPIHTNLLHRRKRFEHYHDLIFVAEDLEELDREIAKLMKLTSRTRLLTTSPLFLSKIASLYGSPPQFRCYAGYATCVITPKAKVSPCSDMDGTISLREMPLEKIWVSPQFQKMRQCVHSCNSSCWDTANAEISIRLRPSSLIKDLRNTWRDLGFYFGDDK